jgi:nitronate monooxygenase
VLRYSTVAPLAALTGNQLPDLCMYAGEGVGSVRDIPPVADLVARLWEEYMASG